MKRIALVLFLSGLFLIGWFAVQDVSLELDGIRIERANLPDMSLERVEFQREVDGVEWTAKVELVERRGGEIRLLSLDVTGSENARRRWTLHAPAGVFLEERGQVVLSDMRGSIVAGGETAFFEASRAEWNDGETEVLFVEGAAFRRSDFFFEGSVVRASFSGVFSAEKGASFTWSVPKKTE